MILTLIIANSAPTATYAQYVLKQILASVKLK